MNQSSNNDLIQHFTDHGVDIQIAKMVKVELESIFQNKFTRAMLNYAKMDMLNGLDLDPTTRERIQQALAGLVVIQVQSTGCYLSVRSTKSITAGAQYPRKWEQFILLHSSNNDSSDNDSSEDDRSHDDNDGSKGGTVF